MPFQNCEVGKQVTFYGKLPFTGQPLPTKEPMCTTWSTLLFSTRSPPTQTHSSCVAQVFSLLKCRNAQHAPVLPPASQNRVPNETNAPRPRVLISVVAASLEDSGELRKQRSPAKATGIDLTLVGCQGSVGRLAGPDDAHLFSTTPSYGRDACAGCSGKRRGQRAVSRQVVSYLIILVEG